MVPRRRGLTAGVAMSGLVGTAMRHTVTGTDPGAAVADLVAQAVADAGALARGVDPVSAVQLLARAETEWRRGDPSDLDYAQRQTAAGLLRAAADQLTQRHGPGVLPAA